MLDRKQGGENKYRKKSCDRNVVTISLALLNCCNNENKVPSNALIQLFIDVQIKANSDINSNAFLKEISNQFPIYSKMARFDLT